MERHARTFIFPVFYLLIVALVFAAAFEIGFRIKGSYLTYHEQQGYRYQSMYISHDNPYMRLEPKQDFTMQRDEFQVPYSVNSLGYRESEVVYCDTCYPRIFIFGDSFVEGMGALQDSTWPRIFEELIRKKHPKAYVRIFASSSSDPVFNYKVFAERVLPFQPTHVIFAVNPTDIDDIRIRGGMERFRPGGKVVYKDPPWFEPIFRRSFLLRAILVTGYGYDRHLLLKKADRGVWEDTWARIGNCLVRADSLCRENDIRFLALVHPTPLDACSDDGDPQIYNTAAEQIRQVWIIHLFETMVQAFSEVDCQDFYWKKDGHYNNRGYELFARHFLAMLMDEYPDYLDPATFPEP